MMLPDPYRYFKYLNEIEQWYLTGCVEHKGKVIDNAWGRRFGGQTAVSLIQEAQIKSIEEIEKSKDFLSEEKILDLQFRYLYQIQNIEMVCRSFGIKLIWSTWHKDSAKNIKNSQIYDNFISITEEDELLEHLNNVTEETNTNGHSSNTILLASIVSFILLVILFVSVLAVVWHKYQVIDLSMCVQCVCVTL